MTKPFGYEIVYIYLRQLIYDKLKENEKIPSESQLSQKFKLSRSTVRMGISKLVNEGLIYSKKGSGYFVNIKQIEYRLSPYTSFSKEIEKLGKKPSFKIIGIKKGVVDDALFQKCKIQKGSKILQLDIIRFVDGIPFIFSYDYINYEILPNIENYLDENCNSLTRLLKQKFGISLKREYSEIEVVSNHDKVNKHLCIQNSNPLIKVSSRSFDDKNQNIIEYVESYFRSDISKIRIDFTKMDRE